MITKSEKYTENAQDETTITVTNEILELLLKNEISISEWQRINRAIEKVFAYSPLQHVELDEFAFFAPSFLL